MSGILYALQNEESGLFLVAQHQTLLMLPLDDFAELDGRLYQEKNHVTNESFLCETRWLWSDVNQQWVSKGNPTFGIVCVRPGIFRLVQGEQESTVKTSFNPHTREWKTQENEKYIIGDLPYASLITRSSSSHWQHLYSTYFWQQQQQPQKEKEKEEETTIVGSSWYCTLPTYSALYGHILRWTERGEVINEKNEYLSHNKQNNEMTWQVNSDETSKGFSYEIIKPNIWTIKQYNQNIVYEELPIFIIDPLSAASSASSSPPKSKAMSLSHNTKNNHSLSDDYQEKDSKLKSGWSLWIIGIMMVIVVACIIIIIFRIRRKQTDSELMN